MVASMEAVEPVVVGGAVGVLLAGASTGVPRPPCGLCPHFCTLVVGHPTVQPPSGAPVLYRFCIS